MRKLSQFFPCILVAAISTSLFALDLEKVAGWGGYPLSPEVTSLWLTGPASPDKPPPFVLVYFVGASGWHDRQWKVDSEFGSVPGFVKLVSADLALSLEAEPARNLVRVQGQEFSLAKSNVFLVTDFLGKDPKLKVSQLGVFQLAGAPANEPVAATFLREHSDVVALLNDEVTRVLKK